jgi:trehalose 6-phosphate phosphatase
VTASTQLPDLLRDCQPAFFFDLDGTVSEIRSRPDDVVVPQPIIALLDRLSNAVDGAVAILSGRPLEEVDALLAPLMLPAAGLHGGELRFPGGRRLRFEPSPYVRSVVKGGVASLSLPPAAWVEDKHGIAFALHYRDCPDAGETLLEAARSIAAQTHGSYTTLRGDCIVELRPTGQTKGTALHRLMETEPFRERVPIVLGDDHTDEDAFEEALLWEGSAISVGLRQPTCALFGLDDPASVHAWLAEATEELERRRFSQWLMRSEAA